MSFRRWAVVLSGVVALAAVAGPAWADLKIGVVNYSKLMQESPQAKAAQDALRGEFAGKQKELQTQQQSLKSKEDSLQRDSATMTADQPAYNSQAEAQPLVGSSSPTAIWPNG